MRKQPEALRLACELEQAPYSSPCTNDAAAELRRLHKANQVMLKALERIADPRNTHFCGDAQVVARETIAKGEQE